MVDKEKALPSLSSWTSRERWVERVLTFDASWYMVCMGTGILVQLLASNIPYPGQWLRTIGYIFWILDICLFVFFTAMALTRLIMFPKVALSVLNDFQQTSYLGAAPIAWETIGTGLVIFYSSHESAAYVAQVFFWIAVVFTLLVTCGGICAMYLKQKNHSLNEVTGAWYVFRLTLVCHELTLLGF